MITALFIAAALPSALLVLLGAALGVQILRGRTPARVPVLSRASRRPPRRRHTATLPRRTVARRNREARQG